MDATGVDLHVVVVDNDAAQSARRIVADAMSDTAIPVTYDCVVERGLPLVRNRLVELAIRSGADWMLWVDDDSLIESDALQLMLKTAVEYDADCVAPRVPHTFENSESRWAQWSSLFDALDRPTGRPARNFGSNGDLLRSDAVAQIRKPFDVRLVGTGHPPGEDGLFFARFHAQGFKTVGCNEAVIWDRLEPSRNNPQWLIQRALRIGMIKGFIEREVQPSPRKSGKWFVLGVGYAATNLLAAVALYPFGPSRYFRHWVRAVSGYGIMLGVMFPARVLRKEATRIRAR
jgi:hypothetical protein